MEYKYKILTFLFLSISFTACERFEIKGFFTSYNNADERFEQSMDWNYRYSYKVLNSVDDNYLIFVMGDSHIGTTKNLDYFLTGAKNDQAIATVMVGDLTDGHYEDYLRFSQHLPSQDSLVTFQVAGNHDLYFEGWKHFYEFFGTSTFYFAVKTPIASDLYICLDTGGGTLGNKQLAWLKKILKYEREKYRYCVVFTHNNLFRIRHSSSTNPLVQEIRVLTELSVKHRIDMIITGHDHKKNAVNLGNTLHITMDALKDGYEDAGYLKLLNSDGSIKYEFAQIPD